MTGTPFGPPAASSRSDLIARGVATRVEREKLGLSRRLVCDILGLEEGPVTTIETGRLPLNFLGPWATTIERLERLYRDLPLDEIVDALVRYRLNMLASIKVVTVPDPACVLLESHTAGLARHLAEVLAAVLTRHGATPEGHPPRRRGRPPKASP